MSTLAKVKKGETVMLCVFTGMKIGPKEVTACDKSTITINHRKKGDMTFERKTGKLIRPLPENPKFSSFIEEDDGTFVRPKRKGNKNKAKEEEPVKKSKKKKKTKPEDEEPEPEETEEEEAPVKKTKKATKKLIPKIEEIKEEDEDWDDDLEDGDWEDNEDEE